MSEVLRIETLDFDVGSFDWAFARERRAEIDAHFEAVRHEKPGMWNGRVLLMYEHAIDGACLRGRFFETDFASFMAWRDFGFPDASVKNGFALAALQGSDGGYVLGVMSAGTMNSGKIYFPGGTPDPNDIVAAKVDFEASVRRELSEETGLDPRELEIDTGWHGLPVGPMVALLKPMRARETADDLRARILAHLAQEADPELADIYVAHSAADIRPTMPGFIQSFLRSVWG